ncbi:hypothetical protein [Longivirga aurantiaca]|uniref:Uncharacterized protein n=1 Tax=Longivirga aurantiaca TaxID=1837743 RepID=A0ABW1T4T4_9ACTN
MSLLGWGKASWIISLLFIPFLTPLINVVTQGPTTAQRDAQRYTAMRAQQDDYGRNLAARADPTAQIKLAHDPLPSGTIAQAEFDAITSKALAWPEGFRP